MTVELLFKENNLKISKYIYGQFAEHLGRCIYEGLYVGENSPIKNVNGLRQDVVEALKEIKIPVLRWPGGCFADEYHWEDGIGPKENRVEMINTHWGGVTENNHFGTHEFFELVNQLGCEAYINGNVGSGTVREMSEWVEYMTMPGKSTMADLRRKNGRENPWSVKFFGVGNESWGCGGNMRPEYYADLYRQYQTYVRKYGNEKIYKIACGANAQDYHWTEVLMKNAAPFMDGLSLHYYTLPTGNWQDKGSATDFSESVWYDTMEKTLFMDELIEKHSTIMDQYDPEKRIGLIVDEWGTWFNVEPGTVPGFLYQQNTIRDALVAALNLNIFHRHCDRVQMANIAQMVNVLQAMILTDGEKMVKTPTYYVFKMYQYHQDATFIQGSGNMPEKTDYTASIKEDKLTLSLCNYDLHEEKKVSFSLGEFTTLIKNDLLTAEKMNDINDFSKEEKVTIVPFENVKVENNHVTCVLPAKSVVNLRFNK